MHENGVLLHAAKMEALGPFHSPGRQINALRGCGCCLSAADSITSAFKLCSGPWNTSLMGFWPSWRTLFLRRGGLLLAWTCPLHFSQVCLLEPWVWGNCPVRPFSKTREVIEILRMWMNEELWEEKMISPWGKDIRAFYSNEAFWWNRWLIQKTLWEISWLPSTETNSDELNEYVAFM